MSQGKGKSKTEPSTAPSTSVKRPWGGENNGLTCAACSLVLPPIHIVLAGFSTKRAKGDGKGDLKVAKSSKAQAEAAGTAEATTWPETVLARSID